MANPPAASSATPAAGAGQM